MLWLPLCVKKGEHRLFAFFGKNAFRYGEAVVHDGSFANMEVGMDAAGSFVRSTVDQSCKAAVHDCSSAHGTWFYGNIKNAFSQTPPSQAARSLAEGEDFCVRRGVMVVFPAVVGGGDDPVFPYEDGADRDFSFFPGDFCFA